MRKLSKSLLIVLLLLWSSMAQCGVVVLQRGDVGEAWKGGEKNEAPIPVIRYDDTSITIECDSMFATVDIVVKDVSGNVLVEDAVCLNHTYTLYHAPETLGHQRYTIELYFDDTYYYGFFEM